MNTPTYIPAQSNTNEVIDIEWKKLDWLTRKIIDMYVTAICRGWSVKEDEAGSNLVDALILQKKWLPIIHQVAITSFIKGHCVILWSINDGAKPDQPVRSYEKLEYFRIVTEPEFVTFPFEYPGVVAESGSDFKPDILNGDKWLVLKNGNTKVLVHPDRYTLVNSSQVINSKGYSDSWLINIAEPVDQFLKLMQASIDNAKASSMLIFKSDNLSEMSDRDTAYQEFVHKMYDLHQAYEKAKLMAIDRQTEELEVLGKGTSSYSQQIDDAKKNLNVATGLSDSLLWGVKGGGLGNDNTDWAYWQTVVIQYQELIIKPIIEFFVTALGLDGLVTFESVEAPILEGQAGQLEQTTGQASTVG